MTAVSSAGAPAAAPPAAGPAVPASCRVSLLVGSSHQIDLVLPAAVPLAALTDATRDAVNRYLRSAGADELPHDAYVFTRAVGATALAADLSLAAQGVADADLLAFVPAGAAQRYEPNIENVSTAIARWAKNHFPTVTPRDAVGVGVGLTVAALATAGLIIWRLRWASSGGWLAPDVFGATAAVLVAAAVLGSRMRAQRFVIGALTWSALAAGVAAGASAPPGPHPVAPHAFLAALVAAVGGLLLARFTGRYWVGVSAVVTVAAAVFAAAAVRMFLNIPGQRIAVVMLVAVLVASRAAPALGLRMARVPKQSFGSITGRDLFHRAPGQPEDTVSPLPDAPHDVTLRGEQIAQVALRSNRVLTGTLLGIAVVQVAASWCAIHPGVGSQWPCAAVVAVVALIAVLRARAFRDRRHAITVVCGAALSLIALPAHYGLAAGGVSTATGLTSAAVVLAVAVCALIAGAVVPSHIFSEPIREVVEYSEYLATALIIPFAAWAIGLLHYIRYH
ncbi:MAG: type VII secretion integral membrane protein EccD [Mycobacterium sp.]|nr:type VII secretion integral membrane protein EccD [Mycobacterium sp.]